MTEYLKTTPGTRIEIRTEELPKYGLICYTVMTDPDGTEWSPWSFEDDDLDDDDLDDDDLDDDDLDDDDDTRGITWWDHEKEGYDIEWWDG